MSTLNQRILDFITSIGADVKAIDARGVTPRAAIAGQSFTAVTTEQVLLHKTIPANALSAGVSFRLHIEGYLTQTAVASSMLIKVRIGSAAAVSAATAPVCAAGGWSLNATRTNVPFSIDAVVTCRQTGSGGLILGGVNHYGELTTGSESSPGQAAIQTAAAVDTTVSNDIAMTLTPGVNTITNVNITVDVIERIT